MAEEKKNPLIGAFRSPPPKEAAKAPPDAKVAESVKPSTDDKPIPAAQKPAEPVKPVIPPKVEETKAAPKPNSTATPVKPTVEKPAVKPPVPAKAEDAKAAVKPAMPAKLEEAKEAKPTAKPEEKKAEKLTTEKIEQTVAPTKREMSPPLKVTFSEDELRAYFPKKDTTVGDVKRVVFEALDLRQKALDRQKARAEQEKAAKKRRRVKRGDGYGTAGGFVLHRLFLRRQAGGGSQADAGASYFF